MVFGSKIPKHSQIKILHDVMRNILQMSNFSSARDMSEVCNTAVLPRCRCMQRFSPKPSPLSRQSQEGEKEKGNNAKHILTSNKNKLKKSTRVKQNIFQV